MSPGKISEKVITERLAWIEDMVAGIRALPLTDLDSFVQDPRNVAAAESYLMCVEQIEDVLRIAYRLRDWVASHPANR
jgi:hypothetical protein